MHPNPAFRDTDQARALVTARERGFGIVTVAGPDRVLASHVPFVLEPLRVGMHFVRSNPLARLLRDGPVDALLAVSGPDGYISPDWYGIEDQVPTWNYVAVHLRGQLRLLPDEALRGHLEDLSAVNEALLAPKKPWTLDKNDPETLSRMMRQLVPVEMSIETVESTFKLNQNKDDAVRRAAADAIEARGNPMLAALMRNPGRE